MNTVSVKFGTATFKGRRKENEDSMAVLQTAKYQGILVADGMGGHLGGAVASKMVADGLLQSLEKLNGSPEELVPAAIVGTSRYIHEKSTENEALSGMGSTLAMTLSDGFNYWVFHVGDSRIYLVHGNDIKQLTVDHTVVEDSIQKGLMTEESALKSRYRHAILQCLGHEEDPESSVLGPEPIKPGSIFMACSDGLSNFVSEMEILDVLKGTENPQIAAEQLLRKAYYKNSDDNISIAIMECGLFARDKSRIPALPPIHERNSRKSKLPVLAAATALIAFLASFISLYLLPPLFKTTNPEMVSSETGISVTQVDPLPENNLEIDKASSETNVSSVENSLSAVSSNDAVESIPENSDRVIPASQQNLHGTSSAQREPNSFPSEKSLVDTSATEGTIIKEKDQKPSGGKIIEQNPDPSSKIKASHIDKNGLKIPITCPEELYDKSYVLIFEVFYDSATNEISPELISVPGDLPEDIRKRILTFSSDTLKEQRRPEGITVNPVPTRIHFEKNNSYIQFLPTTAPLEEN